MEQTDGRTDGRVIALLDAHYGLVNQNMATSYE